MGKFKNLLAAAMLFMCAYGLEAGEAITDAGCLTCTNGKMLTFNADVQVTGTITFLGAVVDTSSLTLSGDLTLSGGVGALTFTDTLSSVVLIDNDASALDIGSTGLLNLMRFVTTDSSESVQITGTLVGTGTAAWFSVQAAANQACNTTCTAPCVFGVNTAATEADIVACTDATADECLCAGPA